MLELMLLGAVGGAIYVIAATVRRFIRGLR